MEEGEKVEEEGMQKDTKATLRKKKDVKKEEEEEGNGLVSCTFPPLSFSSSSFSSSSKNSVKK